MSRDEEVDFVIIGAGLAGLTLRKILGNCRVVVLDPRPLRYKLGESLTPEHLRHPIHAALRRAIPGMASFSPKVGSLYVSDDSVAAFPLPPDDYAFGAHLRREELEGWMMRHWEVEVLRERVVSYDPEEGVVVTNARRWRVGQQVFDCSGVARVLARALGLERELWRSFSSWMYFDIRAVRDDRFAPMLTQTGRRYARFDPGLGHPLGAREYPGWAPSSCTTVCRVRDGVFAWQIPLYQKSVLSFGVTSRHGPISREALADIAARVIVPCFEVSPRPFDGASDYNRFHVFNRFSRAATRPASERWVLVGDAGFFGEPIYATGTAAAVNQAILVGEAVRDGGWTEARCASYCARWRYAADAALEARRFAFEPAGAPAVADGVYGDQALEGTAFQLTMARRYGRVLDGIKALGSPEQFTSRFRCDPAVCDRTTASLRAALDPPLGRLRWRVLIAYPTGGGLQLALEHPDKPPLTLRVERAAPGARYFAVASGFGIAYKRLPEGPYPFDELTRGALELVAAQAAGAPGAWDALIAAEPEASPAAPSRAGVADPEG